MAYTATRSIGKGVTPGCFWTTLPLFRRRPGDIWNGRLDGDKEEVPWRWQGDHGWCVKSKPSRRFRLFFQVGGATSQKMVREEKGPFNMNQLGAHFLVGEGQLVFVGQTVLDRPLPLARNSGWWSASYPDVTLVVAIFLFVIRGVRCTLVPRSHCRTRMTWFCWFRNIQIDSYMMAGLKHLVIEDGVQDGLI